jgi:hypothetical protein
MKPIRPFDYGDAITAYNKVAVITRSDIVEACDFKPDECEDAYIAFEAAVDAALEDYAARRDIQNYLRDALDEIAQTIQERMARDARIFQTL